MRLWLDDIRLMPKTYDIHAKNADEAITILKLHNITHISFDHDLGDINKTDDLIVTWKEHEKTGYEVAKWIENQAFKNLLPPLTWSIHSSNPRGVENIRMAMKNAQKYWIKYGCSEINCREID